MIQTSRSMLLDLDSEYEFNDTLQSPKTVLLKLCEICDRNFNYEVYLDYSKDQPDRNAECPFTPETMYIEANITGGNQNQSSIA